MKLSLWYVPGTEDQIAIATKAAADELEKRRVTVEEAFAATIELNDLDDDADVAELVPEVLAVSAWYAAENAAFETLAQLTGEWPSEGALIVTEGRRAKKPAP
ncbi:MAG: hypothetical protein ACREPY_12535 [Rhodanobacteraceae bacterium]